MKLLKIDRLVQCFILGVFAMMLNSCKKETAPIFEVSKVWDVRENQVDGYRIPGLVTATDGSVLAFSEERPKYGDEDPKSIVVKRSTDKGKTWSKSIYIEKSNGQFWMANRDLLDNEDLPNKQEVWTNIAPIVDQTTGRIYFFYSLSEGAFRGQNLQRYTKVFYRYSDDHGLTWSDRTEVTDILNAKADGSPNVDENGQWITDENGFPCDYLGRAFHMPGPGHGIQLSNGRLLLQVWNRKALGVLGKGQIPVPERKYGICTIYSDDHGATWQYGSSFGHELNMNESRMVELSNGDIYLNARYVNSEPNSRNNHRIVAISKDKGINWEVLGVDKNFPLSRNCDAGLTIIKQTKSGNDVILYSKNESQDGRKNLKVRLSEDGGKTWPIEKVIDPGEAWYSDMTVLDDQSVLLIYETDKNSPVYCVRFNLEWLKSDLKVK